MESTKGYILIVENDEDVRERFANLLNLEGYLVYSFHSREKAIECYQTHPIDLAMIDYRLSDDNNPNDNSGLVLTNALEGNLVKILMSAFGPNMFGQKAPANTWQFDKNQGPEEMVDLVNQLFETQVQVNHNLIIDRDTDIEAILPKSKNDPITQNKHRIDLIGLFQRLFFYEKSIQLKYIQQGYGGSGVVRVTPYYASGDKKAKARGADVIVKFGDLQNMDREFDRYTRHVETFLGMRATDVVGSMKKSGSLAGIKFRLIGSQAEWDQPNEVKSFEDAFLSTSLSDKEITAVIDDLFQNTCHLWYAGKYQAQEPKQTLCETYMEHFRLDSDERLTEVDEIIDALVDKGDEDRLTIKHVEPHYLEFDFNNNFMQPCILMNPLVLIECFPEKFPKVYYWSITHGDMNEKNIFVDESQKTWLIDFFRTGEGPALRDVIQLETSIKFFMYREMNLPKRLEFEWNVLKPQHFRDSDYVKEHVNGNKKVAASLKSIRAQAAAINGDEDMTEYYAGMMFNTLRVLTLDRLNPEEDDAEARIRRKHALFSASLLAHKFAQNID